MQHPNVSPEQYHDHHAEKAKIKRMSLWTQNTTTKVIQSKRYIKEGSSSE